MRPTGYPGDSGAGGDFPPERPPGGLLPDGPGWRPGFQSPLAAARAAARGSTRSATTASGILVAGAGEEAPLESSLSSLITRPQATAFTPIRDGFRPGRFFRGLRFRKTIIRRRDKRRQKKHARNHRVESWHLDDNNVEFNIRMCQKLRYDDLVMVTFAAERCVMSPEKLTPEATAEIPSPEGAPLPTVEEYYGAYFQLSRVVCYPEELNQQEFTGFRNAMFYDANPQGPIEKMLLDRLASLIWRLRRAGGLKASCFPLSGLFRRAPPRRMTPPMKKKCPLCCEWLPRQSLRNSISWSGFSSMSRIWTGLCTGRWPRFSASG